MKQAVMAIAEAAPSVPVISTVRQFSDHYPAFSQASLRYLIFFAETNGLAKSGALIRLGRKVLIDEALFIDWVRSHASIAAA